MCEEHLLLLFVSDDGNIIGTCFGKFNREENWADMLGLAVKQHRQNEGIGTKLVKKFEQTISDFGISTIDLFADESRKSFFADLGYQEGRTYTAFRKTLNK